MGKDRFRVDNQLVPLLAEDLPRELETQSPDYRPYVIASVIQSRLGPLAPYWLRPQVLEEARGAVRDSELARLPDLARRPRPAYGLALVTCCVGNCANESAGTEGDGGEAALLRPALVLPFRWQRDGDPTGVPEDFLQLADRVKRELENSGERGLAVGDFQLTWAYDELRQVDAGGLQCETDSGFFALAASLYMAAREQDGQVDPRVWITGGWDSDKRTVQSVGGIARKIRTMLDFGAKHIFVPAPNLDEAEREVEKLAVRNRCRVEDLSPARGDVRNAFRNVLKVFRAEPAADAPFSDRADYYKHLFVFNRTEDRKYYRNHLLDDIIEKCRERLSDELRRISEKGPIVVTTLSNQCELVRLAHGVFRPSRMIVLRTAGGSPQSDFWEKHKDILEQWQREYGLDCEARRFPAASPEEATQSANALYRELQDVPEERPIVVDLTPGLKHCSLALAMQAPPRAVLVYLQHAYDPRVGCPDPGTEAYTIINHRRRAS
ncbi:MAG: hypothetical protein D6725_10930 [Planctomycetota bacterium]|nr:MAG: hypothetical protein D6725_10930 [Planctomycetota bacterium]